MTPRSQGDKIYQALLPLAESLNVTQTFGSYLIDVAITLAYDPDRKTVERAGAAADRLFAFVENHLLEEVIGEYVVEIHRMSPRRFTDAGLTVHMRFSLATPLTSRKTSM